MNNALYLIVLIINVKSCWGCCGMASSEDERTTGNIKEGNEVTDENGNIISNSTGGGEGGTGDGTGSPGTGPTEAPPPATTVESHGTVYLVLQTMNSGTNEIISGVSYQVLEPKLDSEASGTTNQQGIHVFDKSMKVFKEGMKVKIEAKLQGFNTETFEYTLSNLRDQLFIIVMTKDLGGGEEGAIKIVMGWKNDNHTAAEDLDLHLNEFTKDFKKKTCSVWGIEFYKNNHKYDPTPTWEGCDQSWESKHKIKLEVDNRHYGMGVETIAIKENYDNGYAVYVNDYTPKNHQNLGLPPVSYKLKESQVWVRVFDQTYEFKKPSHIFEMNGKGFKSADTPSHWFVGCFNGKAGTVGPKFHVVNKPYAHYTASELNVADIQKECEGKV